MYLNVHYPGFASLGPVDGGTALGPAWSCDCRVPPLRTTAARIPARRRRRARPTHLMRPSRFRVVEHGWGKAERRAGFRIFPHFAPPRMTCAFVGQRAMTTMFGLVLVEEGGVQWGAVE